MALSGQQAGDLYHALHMETRNCPSCKGDRVVQDVFMIFATGKSNVPDKECGRCARSLAVLSSIDGMTAEERTGQRALDFMVEDLGWIHNV